MPITLATSPADLAVWAQQYGAVPVVNGDQCDIQFSTADAGVDWPTFLQTLKGAGKALFYDPDSKYYRIAESDSFVDESTRDPDDYEEGLENPRTEGEHQDIGSS